MSELLFSYVPAKIDIRNILELNQIIGQGPVVRTPFSLNGADKSNLNHTPIYLVND